MFGTNAMHIPAISRRSPFLFETFRFQVRIRTLTVLPPYKGAVFRGAFVNAFRRLACSTPSKDCERCNMHNTCLYITFFKPSPPEDYSDAGKFSNPPPPYVLKPPQDNRQSFHPQEILNFELTLIGKALDALPYFIFAFDQIGTRGLGRERGRFELHQVRLQRNGDNYLIYDGNEQTLRPLPLSESKHLPETSPVSLLAIEIQTPLRIKRKGKLVTRLDFSTLFKSLAQRLTLLSTFYGQNCIPDLSNLDAQATQVKTIQDRTFWYDWPRYSTSQKELMKFGGLRGRITFEGDLTPFIPWLLIGEQILVGQGTAFGLGGYQIKF
ncbi:MAG: CRISPR system precrRNA processing endoribonuclease RAMP protein Cas6 [Desulfobacteraceae bacterium]|nr:CRISPR system precrRNA processing endoribonuclease RAMP protein Cas6 [Desulfobacteraceae bacterium]